MNLYYANDKLDTRIILTYIHYKDDGVDLSSPREVSKHSAPPFLHARDLKLPLLHQKTDLASLDCLPRPRMPSGVPFGDFRMEFVFVSPVPRNHIT